MRFELEISSQNSSHIHPPSISTVTLPKWRLVPSPRLRQRFRRQLQLGIVQQCWWRRRQLVQQRRQLGQQCEWQQRRSPAGNQNGICRNHIHHGVGHPVGGVQRAYRDGDQQGGGPGVGSTWPFGFADRFLRGAMVPENGATRQRQQDDAEHQGAEGARRGADGEHRVRVSGALQDAERLGIVQQHCVRPDDAVGQSG